MSSYVGIWEFRKFYDDVEGIKWYFVMGIMKLWYIWEEWKMGLGKIKYVKIKK